MEMPPESKVTPLPTKATGRPRPPDQRMTTSCGSRALPWATPKSAPMPSFSMRARPSTSTATPSFLSVRAWAASVTG